MMGSRSGIIWLIVLCLAILIIAYFYSQQVDECDSKGGVVVKSGINNVCVDPKK